MSNDFDKIRLKNRTIYIHKDFRNPAFEQALLAGEEKLRQHYPSNTIASSRSARVYRFTVNFNGVSRAVYHKNYLCRSACDLIKHWVRASRASRAFKATNMLARNGFGAPAVVAMGERKTGLLRTTNFLVTLEVEGAKHVHLLVDDRTHRLTKERLTDKRKLIRALGQTVGKMHNQGIFHGDLRLGNVLARKQNNCWRFFFLDNERTKKFQRLPAGLRLKNLVQVNMFQHGITNTDRMRFFSEYWAQKPVGRKHKAAFINKILTRTNRRLNRKKLAATEPAKSLRTNARYLRIKAGRNLAVFDTEFCPGADALDFMDKIDALMDEGQILKDGHTCRVSRLTWNAKDVVVKRYNHRGFIHSLRHTIKGSRARRGWVLGHRLALLNIPTPTPLAYIEHHKKALVWKSYLVTEYVRGPNLHYFLRDDNVARQQRWTKAEQLLELVDRLGRYRITHGDLKHSNILVTENGVALTDLDSVKTHRVACSYRARRARDIARFLREKDIPPGLRPYRERSMSREMSPARSQKSSTMSDQY